MEFSKETISEIKQSIRLAFAAQEYEIVRDRVNRILDCSDSELLLSEMYIIMCKSYLNQDRLEDAKRIAMLWQEKLKDDENSLVLLSIIAEKQGDKELEEKFLVEALELNPDNDCALSNLGDLCFENNDYERAIEYFQRAHDIDGNDIDALKMLGVCCKQLDDRIPEARKFFKMALSIDKKDAFSLYKIGWTYFFEDNYKMAKRYFKKCLKLDKCDSDAIILLAEIFIHEKRFKKARRLLKRCASAHPNDERTYLYLGSIALEKSDLILAEKCFLHCIQIDPDYEHALLGLSQTYKMLGQEQESKKHLELAHRVDPDCSFSENFCFLGEFSPLSH